MAIAGAFMFQKHIFFLSKHVSVKCISFQNINVPW